MCTGELALLQMGQYSSSLQPRPPSYHCQLCLTAVLCLQLPSLWSSSTLSELPKGQHQDCPYICAQPAGNMGHPQRARHCSSDCAPETLPLVPFSPSTCCRPCKLEASNKLTLSGQASSPCPRPGPLQAPQTTQ